MTFLTDNDNNKRFVLIKIDISIKDPSALFSNMGTVETDHNNGEQTPTGKRKSKKVMSDGSISWENAEDRFEGNRIKFLEDLKLHKIKSDKYSKDMCKQLAGHELTVAHFQREGFTNPIFVPEKDGLGNGIR